MIHVGTFIKQSICKETLHQELGTKSFTKFPCHLVMSSAYLMSCHLFHLSVIYRAFHVCLPCQLDLLKSSSNLSNLSFMPFTSSSMSSLFAFFHACLYINLILSKSSSNDHSMGHLTHQVGHLTHQVSYVAMSFTHSHINCMPCHLHAASSLSSHLVCFSSCHLQLCH